MTRLGKLSLFLATLATVLALGLTPMTWPATDVLLVWAAALALAVGVAILVDDVLWRREASYERWRQEWITDKERIDQ